MYSLWATLGWLLYEHSIPFIHVHVSGALLWVFHYNILNTIISNDRTCMYVHACTVGTYIGVTYLHVYQRLLVARYIL